MSATSIPVTIVAGYLGAGKTTLINHLLRCSDGRRLAVLVNEFGDLPIDADLIEAREDDLIAIAGGCICCSFGSDLVAALLTIKSRAPAIDHIVIEASGVALPGSVVQATALLPNLSVDGVIVVADAETIEQRSRDRYMSDTVLRQLADADLVLLNKIDLVTAAQAERVSSWLGTQVPRARVLAAENSQIPIELALGLRTDRLGARGTARLHDTSRYESFALERGEIKDVEQLGQRLSDPRLGVLRAKGIVRDAAGQLHVLHIVGDRVSTSAAPGAEGQTTRLVFIGLSDQIDRNAILAILSGGRFRDKE
jgi:G3E family GTPase